MTDQYDTWLQRAAQWYGLDWNRLKAQMIAESAGNPAARSPVGALGLFQFMPSTWVDTPFARYGLPTDPLLSIAAGAWYMDRLLGSFGDDYRKALAAYNWGGTNVHHAVARYGGAWETGLPRETRAYLTRILGT